MPDSSLRQSISTSFAGSNPNKIRPKPTLSTFAAANMAISCRMFTASPVFASVNRSLHFSKTSRAIASPCSWGSGKAPLSKLTIHKFSHPRSVPTNRELSIKINRRFQTPIVETTPIYRRNAPSAPRNPISTRQRRQPNSSKRSKSPLRTTPAIATISMTILAAQKTTIKTIQSTTKPPQKTTTKKSTTKKSTTKPPQKTTTKKSTTKKRRRYRR